jgi:hypothetical protein
MGFSRAGSSSRRGTTAVEVAVVLPVFLLIVFAIIQLGHVSMVENLLQSGCRQAARLGATENVSTAQAEAEAAQIIGSGIRLEAVNIIVRDASVYDTAGEPPTTSEGFHALDEIELTDAETRQLFLVRAEVMYNEVAPLSLPWMKNVRVVGHTVMRHE